MDDTMGLRSMPGVVAFVPPAERTNCGGTVREPCDDDYNDRYEYQGNRDISCAWCFELWSQERHSSIEEDLPSVLVCETGSTGLKKRLAMDGLYT